MIGTDTVFRPTVCANLVLVPPYPLDEVRGTKFEDVRNLVRDEEGRGLGRGWKRDEVCRHPTFASFHTAPPPRPCRSSEIRTPSSQSDRRASR